MDVNYNGYVSNPFAHVFVQKTWCHSRFLKIFGKVTTIIVSLSQIRLSLSFMSASRGSFCVKSQTKCQVKCQDQWKFMEGQNLCQIEWILINYY